MEELFRHPSIGFDQDRQFVEGARAMGGDLQEPDFDLRCDSLLAQAALVSAGAGVGVMHAGLAGRGPDLRRVVPEMPLPPWSCGWSATATCGRTAASGR